MVECPHINLSRVAKWFERRGSFHMCVYIYKIYTQEREVRSQEPDRLFLLLSAEVSDDWDDLLSQNQHI